MLDVIVNVPIRQLHQYGETQDFVFLDYGRLKRAFNDYWVLTGIEGAAATLWGGRKIMARYAALKPLQE